MSNVFLVLDSVVNFLKSSPSIPAQPWDLIYDKLILQQWSKSLRISVFFVTFLYHPLYCVQNSCGYLYIAGLSYLDCFLAVVILHIINFNGHFIDLKGTPPPSSFPSQKNYSSASGLICSFHSQNYPLQRQLKKMKSRTNSPANNILRKAEGNKNQYIFG